MMLAWRTLAADARWTTPASRGRAGWASSRPQRPFSLAERQPRRALPSFSAAASLSGPIAQGIARARILT